jgi:hypothetical protein
MYTGEEMIHTADLGVEAPVLLGAGLVGGERLVEGTGSGTLPAGAVGLVLAGAERLAPTAHGAVLAAVGLHARLAVLERRAVAAVGGIEVPATGGNVTGAVGRHVGRSALQAQTEGRAPTAVRLAGTVAAVRVVRAIGSIHHVEVLTSHYEKARRGRR